MYRCEKCNKLSKKGDKCNFLVTDKRPQKYYETYMRIDRATRKKTEHTKMVGEGWETIQEIKVCNDCYAKINGGI